MIRCVLRASGKTKRVSESGLGSFSYHQQEQHSVFRFDHDMVAPIHPFLQTVVAAIQKGEFKFGRRTMSKKKYVSIRGDSDLPGQT
jgi:hypothetical protein